MPHTKVKEIVIMDMVLDRQRSVSRPFNNWDNSSIEVGSMCHYAPIPQVLPEGTQIDAQKLKG